MALVLCTLTDVQTGLAAFDAPVDASSVQYAYNWSLVSVGTGRDSAVTVAQPRADGQFVDLIFNPPLTPGEAYQLTADNAQSSGVPLAPGDKTCGLVAPGASLPVKENYQILEAVTWCFAEEMAYLAGRPETRLVDEVPEGADVLPLETTLGFPASGRVWVENKAFAYTGVQGSTLTGVTPVAPADGVPLTARAWVALDLGSVP